MKFPALPLAAAFLFPVTAFAQEVPSIEDAPLFVYVGTFTGNDSEGIYLFEMDPQTGKWTGKGLAAKVDDPSFVAIHPDRKHLYAVGQMTDAEGNRVAAVSAFSIDTATGKLSLLNQQPSGGDEPCHVSVDPSGKVVLVANYGGGNVASFPLLENGSLGERQGFQQHSGSGPNENRQRAPHAHSINVDPSGQFALAADLGIDQIRIYRLGPNGALEENDPASAALRGGAGPRHLAFHPRDPFVYVINELDSTITAFSFDPDQGRLDELQTLSTLPGDFSGTSTTAEVLVHPSGRFLYGSNRGHDSIVVYRIDAQGKLETVGHESTRGEHPRNFGIDPTGQFLFVANRNTHNIVAFSIDQKTGELTATGDTYSVNMPVCLRFR